MLTDIAARNAVAKDKDFKIADSGGLHLFVATTGRKTWRWKYRFDGKERRMVFGAYPDISLKRARVLRDDAKAVLRGGRDPGGETKRAAAIVKARSGETFEKFARAWHASQKPRWKEVHSDDVIHSMERDLFPAIGSLPVVDIDEPTLLAALRVVEGRGAIETARRLRQRAERVFKFAKGEGAGNGNPAVDIAESMAAMPARRRWPALTDLTKLRTLVGDVDRTGASPVTRLASRFLALTAQRPGMVRRLPWAEIEGVEWNDEGTPSPAALWRVPPARMKLEFDLREDEAYEHLVPLAPQTVSTLRAVRMLSGSGDLAFPSLRGGGDPMSENAIGFMYNRIGYKDVHVPHGWRSAFSTVMNTRLERAHLGDNRLLIDRLVLDLMLAHIPLGMSATEFRYNRARYPERRRELACQWADLLLDGALDAVDLVGGRRRRTGFG